MHGRASVWSRGGWSGWRSCWSGAERRTGGGAGGGGVGGAGVPGGPGADGRRRLAARRAAAGGDPARGRLRRRRAPPGRGRELLGLMAAGMTLTRAAKAAGVSVPRRTWTTKIGGVQRRLLAQSVPALPPARSGTRSPGSATRACPCGRSRRRLGRSAVDGEPGAGPQRGPPRHGYQPERAHQLARARQRRPKPSKLAGNPGLRAAVQGMLTGRYSPEQASGRLKGMHPGDPSMQVSHESIYQSLYVYPRGELKRELRPACARGRALAGPAAAGETRGKIIGAVPIGQRPPEAEGRLVPGHHEGDLVMGSMASNSAVATIVERMTGYLTLIQLPDGHTADAVADAVIERMAALPGLVRPHPDLGQRHRDGPPRPDHRRNRDRRSTSPTPTPPGSAAATRTSTACSASTSPRAPTSAGTPPPSSRPSKTSSTTAPGNGSASTRPASKSLNSSKRPKRCDDPLSAGPPQHHNPS